MAAQEHQRLNEARLNEAAEQFADALVQSYKVVSELGVTTQERNVQLSEEFFNKVVSNLRTQADANLQLSEQIAGQQQHPVEAAQALTHETVDAYMDFANSMFGFWQRTQGGAEVEATEAAERKAEDWEADATDAAQRMAEELGIHLATVEGTGADGRITAWDVRRAAKEQGDKAD